MDVGRIARKADPADVHPLGQAVADMEVRNPFDLSGGPALWNAVLKGLAEPDQAPPDSLPPEMPPDWPDEGVPAPEFSGKSPIVIQHQIMA